MLDKVRRLYGDRKPTHIIVRKTSENPFVFGWMNHTLTKQSCPKSEIRKLYELLVETDSSTDSQTDDAFFAGLGKAAQVGKPSTRLKMVMGKKMFAKGVRVQLLGTCLNTPPTRGRGQPMGGASGGGRRRPVGSIGSDDSQPVMRNPIDRINVTAGELLRYKVPKVKLILSYFLLPSENKNSVKLLPLVAGHLLRQRGWRNRVSQSQSDDSLQKGTVSGFLASIR